MKHLSHRILFSPPIFIARFPTSGGARHFSRCHDEVWRDIRVCVWWDFENCHLPSGVNVFKVGSAITGALRANGIRGPVQITAFGDVLQLSRANQEALSATGINFSHIPNGGKNSSDRSLLVDLMHWVSQNPPPAHLFLVSGDRDFANILHRLRMSNYNILLATKNNAPSVLCSAASIMWNWNSLVKGEELKGTYFNRPPDGSYGSWYGNSKVPLEDPFSIFEQPTCLPFKNMSVSGSELHLRPIPRAVQRQIHHIVNLHPDGISLFDFGEELKNSSVVLDEDFYGHKSLLNLLQSMPNECHIFVKGIEPYVTSQSSVTRNQQLAKSSKSNSKEASVSLPLDVKSSLPPSSREHLRKIEKDQPPHVVKEAAKVDIDPLERVEQPSLVGENVDLVNARLTDSNVELVNAQLTDSNVELVNAHLTDSSVKDKDGTSGEGSFKKMLWKILFGEGVDVTKIKSFDISKEVQIPGNISNQRTLAAREKCSTSGDSADNIESPTKGFDSVRPASCSVSNLKPILGNNTTFNSDTLDNKSGKSLGLYSRVLHWFKFKVSGSNSQRSSDEPSQELEHASSSSRKHQVFAEDSFWKDLESFVATKNALLIISQSTTRQQMAQNLLKEGPLILKTLKEIDILELIDILISEKKWLEECLSEASPFKLTHHVGSHTSSGGSPSNGLRSLPLSEQAQPNLKSGDKRIQNVSHAGVTGRFVATNRAHLGKTKKEVLNDCQKLANENPEGCNMSLFRGLFRDKYGYDLDFRKFGCNKLSCLLRTIPGIKVESSIVFPASKALKSEGQGTSVSESITSHKPGKSDCKLSDDEPNSLWDELGPVVKIGSKRNKPIHADYEPVRFDDYDSSESDGKYEAITQKKEQAKLETTEESSSLLELLHAYDDDQVDDKKSGMSEDVQGEADSNISSERWNSCGRRPKLGSSSGKYVMKQKPKKYYSFVAETGGSTVEKLFETDDKN